MTGNTPPRMPAEKIIEAIHEGTARATGGEFFRELARCLGETLGVRYAFVGKFLTEGKVSTVAVWGEGDSSRSFQYSLDGTPCENVLGQGTCFYPRHVQTVFPTDHLLAEIDAESYMGTPLRDAAGETNGLLVVMDDRPMADVPLFRRVLEVFAARAGAELGRREAEVALRESEERYRAIAEDTPVLICRFLPGGEITYANKAYCKYFGVSSEELVGSSFFPRISEADRESVRANISALTVDSPTRSHEHRVIAQNGEIRWQRWTNRALFDDTGKVVAYQAIGEDVTDRKRAEEQRLSLERQVQHAQKLESLGVLAGGIAHDFNNLLVAIVGNADLALDELPPLSPVRENIEEIEKASRRAAELAEQMLAYSGKGRFVVEPIDLGELFEEMTHLLEVSMSKKVTLRYDFAETLPPFNGDATQIRQIIMNLITNASEAIGDKIGVITVSTGVMDCDRAYLNDVHETLSAGRDELLPEGRYIYLEVSDTGCGMDAETTGKIFDPFFTTKFAGRGLGLAAVLGIVRGHRGTMKIHSELGKGTTFTVLFRASELPKNGAAIRRRASGVAKARQGQGTILIVDDEETVRAVGKKMLGRMGFSVLTAIDGRDAIDLFRKQSDTIDCVLLDLTMPRLDGEEAFRELRRIRPDVAVILCSGYNEQDATQRFSGKALAGFLHKPYNMATLRETLMEVLPDDRTPLSGGDVGTRHEDLSPLISKFLEAVASDNAQARSALDEGDFKQVSSLGHRIRGTAGFYDFTDLSRLGAELDLAATRKDRAAVEALLDALGAELERLTSRPS